MNCNDCNGACCRWLFIQFNGSREALHFLRTRGARELPDGRIAVPSVCPLLSTENKCNTYETRPLACAVFKVGGKDCLGARKLEGFKD